VCVVRACVRGIQLDGLFYTDAPVLLFKFINQQIDVVRPTACPRSIGLVAEECLTVLERYQKALFHTIKRTRTNLFTDSAIVCVCVCVCVSCVFPSLATQNAEEVDSLYMENILAMINNNHKCHECVVPLPFPLLSRRHCYISALGRD
jgi:hypothetical protein